MKPIDVVGEQRQIPHNGEQLHGEQEEEEDERVHPVLGQHQLGNGF